MKKTGKLLVMVLLVAACILIGKADAKAAAIKPTGQTDGKQDYRNIMASLGATGEARLMSGKTYYIVKPVILHSNQKIYAKGATIICLQGAFRSDLPTKLNYGSIKNVTVDGGTWKNISKDGLKGSMIMFCHGQNITIRNLNVSCNYEGHAVELIATKNVKIDHCKVKALGYCSPNCHEEQIQIDLAAPATAPKVAAAGSKYVQGQTCQNITVQNCTVTGARGICANFAKTDGGKFLAKFHKNIVIKNNRIEGHAAEALALFNVIGATVQDNQIVTYDKNITESYSVGMHIAMFGKAPSGMGSAVFRVTGNVIKGGRQGMLVYSHSSSKFGKLIAKNNKCYAKSGKDNAYVFDCVKQVQLSGNKKYTW